MNMDIGLKKDFTELLSWGLKTINAVCKNGREQNSDFFNDAKILRNQLMEIDNDKMKLKQNLVEVITRIQILGFNLTDESIEENILIWESLGTSRFDSIAILRAAMRL